MTATAKRPNAAIAGVTGAAGGFLSGILGGGGGAIMVPLMTGPLKLRQHVAHGTSLVVIIVTAAVAAVAYAANESISGRLVAALLAGAVIGATLGARAAVRIPATRLRQVFGLFLITVSLRLLVVETIDPLLDISGVAEFLAAVAIGFAGGLASGALGVGGGAIFVPALVLVLGVGQHEAQGSPCG
ncbi:MAG: sulfite exporter TauE/SafE family protein [Dehalococcoidia bacterium]|nr:sulfite exporter TauE/SafE family protein [Dehalococcoidia bacterium]